MTNETTDKCPKCGSPVASDGSSNMVKGCIEFRCGSVKMWDDPLEQVSICHEREQARAEMAREKDAEISDLRNLVSWLAKYQYDLNKTRAVAISGPKLCSDGFDCKVRNEIALHWSVVQGIRNQMDLQKLGEMPIDKKAVGRAVQALLSHGPTQEGKV